MTRYNLITLVKATLKKAKFHFKEQVSLFKFAPIRYSMYLGSQILSYLTMFTSIGKVATVLKIFKYCYWSFILISGICFFVFGFQITELLSVVQIYCFAILGRLDRLIKAIIDFLKDFVTTPVGDSRVVDDPVADFHRGRDVSFTGVQRAITGLNLGDSDAWSLDNIKREYDKAHSPKTWYGSVYDFLGSHKYEILTGIIIISGVTFVVYHNGDPDSMIKAISGIGSYIGSKYSSISTDIKSWFTGNSQPVDKGDTVSNTTSNPTSNPTSNTIVDPKDLENLRYGLISVNPSFIRGEVQVQAFLSRPLNGYEKGYYAKIFDIYGRTFSVLDFHDTAESFSNYIISGKFEEARVLGHLPNPESFFQSLTPSSTGSLTPTNVVPPIKNNMDSNPVTPYETFYTPDTSPIKSPKFPGSFDFDSPFMSKTLNPDINYKLIKISSIIEGYNFTGNFDYVYSNENLKDFFKSYAKFIIEKQLATNNDYKDCFDVGCFLLKENSLNFKIRDEDIDRLIRREVMSIRFQKISTDEELQSKLALITKALLIKKITPLWYLNIQ